MKIKSILCAFVVLVFNSLYAQQADIDILYNRTYNDILRAGFNATNVGNYLLKIDAATGRFTDINYVFNAKTNDIAVAYSPRKHQDRVLEMAIAYVTNKAGNKYYHNVDLLKSLKLVLNDNVGRTHTTIFAWSPNWFDTYIECPKRYANCLILLKSALTVTEFNTYKAHLRDVVITKNDKNEFQFVNGGANTIWAAQVSIKKGILENNTAIISTAYSFITGCLQYMYIEKVHLDGEGIKVDHSYHMHGSQLYMAGYGLGFITDVLVCLKLADGTSFKSAFPAANMEIFSRLLLEGHQYFLFHNSYDWNTSGRQITSPTISNIIMPASIPSDAAIVFPDKATEYTNFANYVKGQALTNVLGSKYFYKSATLASTEANYHLNVKMTSVHVEGTERMTNCGYRNQNMALGSTPIMTKGNEYTNIYPTWDWTRIPGTTTEINQLKVLSSKDSAYWVQATKNPYSGGVAQGSTGIAAFSMKAGENDPDVGITFRKAYFMFDGALICLGNGITASKANSIVTSVNQCHSANNAVYFDGAEKSVTAVQTTTFNNNLSWAFHENVGYVFPSGGNVVVSNKDQSGTWYDINHNYGKNLITNRVFSLWIDHGKTPNNATYEYIIKPGVSLVDFKTFAASNPFTTVTNTATVQAVKSDAKKLYGAVFYQAGTVDFKNGVVLTVDKPAIVLLTGDPLNYTLTVADPLYVNNQVIKVTINKPLAGKNAAITGSNTVISYTMPTGNYTGQAVANQYKLVNDAPQVAITAPADKTTFTAPANIYITANATDADGSISKVEYYNGSSLIFTEYTAPYSQTWKNVAAGTYTIITKAYDNNGAVTQSAPITITVNKPVLTQSIALQKGWNLISTNVCPADSTIATLFTGLNIQEIKSMDAYWMKAQNDAFNSLKTISAGEGYLVKINTAGTLTLTGIPVETRFIASPQQNSWYLIGCPYQTATLFSQDFNVTNCSVIKNFEGFWIPNGNTNSIQNLESGKGYFVKIK